ncbi:hypothetical protein MMC28_010894 [Mycoblastus sanguinarius]|nr:hypothetical protein [Mycoblastus sanguinarius]
MSSKISYQTTQEGSSYPVAMDMDLNVQASEDVEMLVENMDDNSLSALVSQLAAFSLNPHYERLLISRETPEISILSSYARKTETRGGSWPSNNPVRMEPKRSKMDFNRNDSTQLLKGLETANDSSSPSHIASLRQPFLSRLKQSGSVMDLDTDDSQIPEDSEMVVVDDADNSLPSIATLRQPFLSCFSPRADLEMEMA